MSKQIIGFGVVGVVSVLFILVLVAYFVYKHKTPKKAVIPQPASPVQQIDVQVAV